MKILILTKEVPYPLDSGGNVAQFVFSDYLRNEIELTYIFELKSIQDQVKSNKLKQLWPNVKIIDVIAYSDSIDREYSFTRKFKNILKPILNKFTSFFYQHNSAPFKGTIFDKALWFLRPTSEKYLKAIETHIETAAPDLIQIEQVPFITLGSINFKIPTVYVHHEIQTEALKSAQSYTSSKNGYTDYLVNLTKEIEVGLLKKFNHIIVFSSDDKVKLEEFGIKEVYSIPFPFINDTQSIPYSNADVNRLTFIGSDLHFPNIDAIQWYSIYASVIYQKTGLKLHVIGHWSAENIKKFSSDFIIFEGFADQLSEALYRSINIVPLRIGSGIRSKILNALSLKVPVLSTKIGIEGIPAKEGTAYLGFENEKMLIHQINKIKGDSKLFNDIVEFGYELVNQHFAIEVLAPQRLKLFKELVEKHATQSC